MSALLPLKESSGAQIRPGERGKKVVDEPVQHQTSPEIMLRLVSGSSNLNEQIRLPSRRLINSIRPTTRDDLWFPLNVSPDDLTISRMLSRGESLFSQFCQCEKFAKFQKAVEGVNKRQKRRRGEIPKASAFRLFIFKHRKQRKLTEKFFP